MEEKIISYKGFHRDMTCTPPNTDIKFQYEEGEEYETERAEACDCGFHACEHPLDCLGYYSPNESVYHEVEQSGQMSRNEEDSKVASTKIKIGASINIAGMVKAAIEYTTKRVKKESDATGYKGASSATGDYGASSATGNCGASSATGYKAKSVAGDPESIAVAWGYMSKAKGVLGSYLVFADWEGDENEYYKPDSWTLKGAKMVRVDGETIKADTWYRIKNGEILEDSDED